MFMTQADKHSDVMQIILYFLALDVIHTQWLLIELNAT